MTLIEIADLSHPLEGKNIIETTSAISNPAIQFAISNYSVFTQDCHNFIANCLIRDWRARPDYELLIVRCPLVGVISITDSRRHIPSSRTTRSTLLAGWPGICASNPSTSWPGASRVRGKRMNESAGLKTTKEPSLAITFLLLADDVLASQ